MPSVKKRAFFPNSMFLGIVIQINKEVKLARENYSYKKRMKELARKKKQEGKRQRRLDKKNVQPIEGETQVSNENSEQGSDETTV